MAPFVYLVRMATHFSGGSAGREGTTLQMAGAKAVAIFQNIHLDVKPP